MKLTALWKAPERAWRFAFLLALLGLTADFTFDGFIDVLEVNEGQVAISDCDDDWILARRPDEESAACLRPDLPAEFPGFPQSAIVRPTRRDPSPTALRTVVRPGGHRALPRAHLHPELAQSSAAAVDSSS